VALLLRVQTVLVLVCAAGCLSRPAGHGPGDGGGSGGEGSTGSSIGLVQAASMAGSLSTSTDVTLTTPPVMSHFLIVAVGAYPQASNGPSVMDTAGNSYTWIPKTVVSAGGTNLYAFYTQVQQVVSPFLVSANVKLASEVSMAVLEYSGIDPGAPVDQSGGATGTSQTPSSGGVQTMIDGELYVGIASHDSSDLASSGVGYMMQTKTTDDNTNIAPLAVEDKSGPAEATSATFTLSGTAPWACLIVTFRPAP